jgi:hypothetical protein
VPGGGGAFEVVEPALSRWLMAFSSAQFSLFSRSINRSFLRQTSISSVFFAFFGVPGHAKTSAGVKRNFAVISSFFAPETSEHASKRHHIL